ncbi:hypothetical protein Salat_0073700, partial [Sesamum alatum]
YTADPSLKRSHNKGKNATLANEHDVLDKMPKRAAENPNYLSMDHNAQLDNASCSAVKISANAHVDTANFDYGLNLCGAKISLNSNAATVNFDSGLNLSGENECCCEGEAM